MANTHNDTINREHCIKPERVNRFIVRQLIRHLVANNFLLAFVEGGDDDIPVKTEQEAMDAIFDLDEAWLVVSNVARHPRSVFLVLSNDEDVISDWRFGDSDPDGFNAVMEAFTEALR